MTLPEVPKEPLLLHLPRELNQLWRALGVTEVTLLPCCHHAGLVLLGLLGQRQSIPSSVCPAEHQERQEGSTQGQPQQGGTVCLLESSTSTADLLLSGEMCRHREQGSWAPEGPSGKVLLTCVQALLCYFCQTGQPRWVWELWQQGGGWGSSGSSQELMEAPTRQRC